MTPEDIERAAAKLDRHRRAFARCMTSEPHRSADEDVPCSRCRFAAVPLTVSTPASSTATGRSAATGAVEHGAAGKPARTAGYAAVTASPPRVPAPPSEKTTPPGRNPGGAEGAAEPARIEGTR